MPSHFERETVLRLLVFASAGAITAAAAFVNRHAPDVGVSPTNTGEPRPSGACTGIDATGDTPPGDAAIGAAAPGDAAIGAAAPNTRITRAELLQRLRRQTAAAGRTG